MGPNDNDTNKQTPKYIMLPIHLSSRFLSRAPAADMHTGYGRYRDTGQAQLGVPVSLGPAGWTWLKIQVRLD